MKYTVRWLAREAGCSYMTIERYLQKGIIDSYRCTESGWRYFRNPEESLQIVNETLAENRKKYPLSFDWKYND